MREWFYNEFKQTGINFESEEEVRLYDEKYKETRNLDDEARYIGDAIAIRQDSLVLELGTGTRELALRLAKSCK